VVVVLDCLKFFGWRGTDRESVTEVTTNHWLNLVNAIPTDPLTGKADPLGWAKVAKYKISAFASVHLEQMALPPRPFVGVDDLPGVIAGGTAGRYVKMIWNRAKTDALKLRFRGLVQTILQSKKAMPVVTTEDLKTAEVQTVVKLTTKKLEKEDQYLFHWGDVPEGFNERIPIHVTRANVERQLRRTVVELFHKVEYTIEDRLKPSFPSTSANYINSRSGAGAVGTILERDSLLFGLRTPGGTLGAPEDLNLVNDVVVGTSRDGLDDEREEFQDESVTHSSEGARAGSHLEYDTSELRGRWTKLWYRMLRVAETEGAFVKPVALPEALKIRTITKGPPITYTVLRSLWKKLHTTLRNHPTFKFIGTPVTEEGMLDALGYQLKDGEIYLSGDYRDATNNFESWVSETIADEISIVLKLEPIERILFIRALIHHRFNVAEGLDTVRFNMDDEESLPGDPQLAGQLMGSIVSFPVLCIGNAALTRWSWEATTGKRVKLRDCPMSVNGDDVAARGPEGFHANWALVTAKGGLEDSVGKTFVSREFVMINSTMYQRESEPHVLEENPKRISRLRFVPYVHMGALHGRQRSGDERREGKDQSFSAQTHTLIDRAPPAFAAELLDTYILLNMKELQATRVPWFMPEWIGGLGLPHGVSAKYQNSDKDLRVATRILQNWGDEKKRPQAIAARGETQWMIRRLTRKLLTVPTEVTSSKDEGYEALKEYEGYLAVDLLFNSDFQLGDLFNKDTKKLVADSNRANRNADLWVVGQGKIKLPKPISEVALYQNPRFESLSVRDNFHKATKNYTYTPTLPLTTKQITLNMSVKDDVSARRPTKEVLVLD
jgi:hypothetical protein